MEVQHLKIELAKDAGFGRFMWQKRLVAVLERSLAESLEKLATTEERVRKLDEAVEEAKLRRASAAVR